MNNSIIFTAILIIINFALVAVAIFGIGFFIGYKYEDRKIKLKKENIDTKEIVESDKEKKAKKEWRKFLEYDGSTPQEKM